MSEATSQILDDARKALQWLLNNIKQDAPQFSGKAMGNAERVVTAIDAALAQPAPSPQPTRHLTVTTTESGEAVLVSWQDDDHRILEVVWERGEAAPQPAVPVVSDEQILEAAREWSNSNFVACSERFLLDFARALLALRPAVEPMTDEQIVQGQEQQGAQSILSFMKGVRFAEAHHGITAKAEGGA